MSWDSFYVDNTTCTSLRWLKVSNSGTDANMCNIGIDLDPSKPKGMPFDLKLHTYSFTTKYINMAKA